MRLAILWTHESRYLLSIAHEALRQGHSVMLHSFGQAPSSPFQLEYGSALLHYQNLDYKSLVSEIDTFAPDRVLVAGWHIPQYRRISFHLRGRSIRFMSMDNQWRGTIRQRLGTALFRLKYRWSFDYALVPGPRQAAFARKLGFIEDRIARGGLPCDVELFSTHAREPETYFLTAARLAPEKGIETLLQAYHRYRKESTAPWRLVICGAGPLQFKDEPGVTFRGFTAPEDLARLMGRAGAFVLPSHFEPWGVVLHEAAAAGRYIIATSACGAADVMITPGLNGVVVSPGDVEDLYATLLRAERLSPDEMRLARAESSRLTSAASPMRLLAVLQGTRHPSSEGVVKI